MRQTNVRGTLSLRGFRKLRTGAIVATGVILLGLGFLAPTVSANEQDGVWVARTVAEVKADIQKEGDLFKYVIKWGDTLSVISEASNIPVDVLQEMNQASGKNLFLPHNELYFTEAETVSDTVTKHKIVIKESGASGEVRTYEVLIKKDQETKALTFELTDVTEKVEKMAVNYSPVYQPVSAPIVESAEESGEELAPVSPVVTSPEVKEETEAPVVPKAEEAATTPAPKAEEPVSPAPKVDEPVASMPKSEEPAAPAPKVEEPETPAPKVDEPVATTPKSDEPAASAPKVDEPVSPAPKVDEPTTPTPKVEEPAPTTPKSEEPVGPAPKAEEPVSPAPKSEEPAPTTPKSEEPVAPVPKVEEPATPAPKSEEPTTPAPKVEEPVTPAPKVEEPASSAPKSEEPVATTPKSEEPVATTPKSDEPAVTTPKAEEPATPAPKSEEPATPAPKAEEPVSSAPKVEEPATPAPKSEEPAVETTPKAEEPAAGTTPKSDEPAATTPKADEPAATEPKADEPVVTTPKDDESASSVESPSTGNHSEESGAPSTTPTGDSTATQPSDSTSTPVTPSEEAPVTSGDTNSTTQPAGETGHSETTAEPSNTPSADATNDSGSAATSGSVTDNTSSNTGTADQPVASNPSSEEPTASAPKAEEPSAGTTPKAEEPSAGTTPKADEPAAGTTPKEDTPSEEVAPKDEKLEEAKKDGKDAIEKIAASKLSEIEKVKDEAEKAKLEAKLKELKEAGLEAINNAKDHDAAVDATDEYQTKIDEINVPGEELPAPNYNKDNLTNGRNEGTTINDGSTAIGHGSGEATATTPAQPSSNSERTSSFRNAPSVQARARRVARSTSEPDGTVNISYNFAGMPDIHGFLSDPGENNTVTIPAGTSEAQAKELVKEKIQAKIKDLATRGYHVKNDIIFEQDTTVKNYNYVVTFAKEATGTSGFRMAPAVQPRASRNRRSLEQPAPQKVKVNVFYNFDQMKDIAGFLGDINGTPLEVAEGSTNEQVKAAVKNQVDAKKEELRKRGYTFKEDYVYQANGKDYNYVVTFTKEATGTSGFRMAPAVQPRASRNRRSLEQPAPQKVKVNVFYNFDQMKDIAGFLGDINGTSLEIAEGLSNEEVKVAVKKQVEAKKEELSKRGYTFKEDYVYQSNGKDYNYVVTFSKATK
ncbi:hypothetical protein HMPREF1048_1927 [Streptococcus mitis SK575]|uniref:LysM domain-containing protein n=1 Tax=Streptococcus mitis SK575 TaxID=1095736 RepID=I0SZY0_STRMT|nr:hypothetical protein [Streptococcus mitis]EID28933.1 hypothetical protein HMPREF1048_1927 [Streptococcus mitis SK575]